MAPKTTTPDTPDLLLRLRFLVIASISPKANAGRLAVSTIRMHQPIPRRQMLVSSVRSGPKAAVPHRHENSNPIPRYHIWRTHSFRLIFERCEGEMRRLRR